jgi:hypothetical protein
MSCELLGSAVDVLMLMKVSWRGPPHRFILICIVRYALPMYVMSLWHGSITKKSAMPVTRDAIN